MPSPKSCFQPDFRTEDAPEPLCFLLPTSAEAVGPEGPDLEAERSAPEAGALRTASRPLAVDRSERDEYEDEEAPLYERVEPLKWIITRSGIFNKVGHDLPLSRISDVQHDSSITDRIFGAGTLSLQTSSNDPLLLEDVPKIEIVQVKISNLLFNNVQGTVDANPDD